MMRSIESLIKLDLAFSILCLQHKYHRPMVRLSRAISHTGDGHLYAVVGLIAFLFGGEQGKTLLVVGLLAFSIELPVYWLAKNIFKRDTYSKAMADAGIGFAISSEQFGLNWTGRYFENVWGDDPLIVRFDIPFYLNNPPNQEEKFQFRWLLGLTYGI